MSARLACSYVGFDCSAMHPFPSARPDRFDPMLLYLYPATALLFITPIYLLFSSDSERQDTPQGHGSTASKLVRCFDPSIILDLCADLH